MFSPLRQRWLWLAGILFVLVSQPCAQAGFMSAYSGTTRMADNAGAEGIVNFAVFDNTADNLSFLTKAPFLAVSGQATALSGTIDGTADYVYMFQIVNDDPFNPEFFLDTFQLTAFAGTITSAGYFSNTIFTDTVRDNGTTGTNLRVGPTANKYLGIQPGSPNADDPLDGSPTHAGVPSSTIGLATIPKDSNQNPYNPGSADLSTATIEWDAPGVLRKLGYSSVFFFTSNLNPGYGPATIAGGTANGSERGSSSGDVPVPTPEPSTLLLWSLGLGSVLGMVSWRRWRGTPVTVPLVA